MEILSLGEKIKRRRKCLNMTLKDLAGDRITPGQISLVESGKSNPSMDLLEYLADALNTSIEYLMESEETQAEKICVYFENIAESYIVNGDLNEGERYIEKALYYAEKYNLEYRKAKNLYLRGIMYVKKSEFALAQQFFLSANVLFIKHNNYEEIIKTFVNLGKITMKLKAYQSSCSYLQQAENVYNENVIGNDFLRGEIYYCLASVYFKLQDLEKSINYSYLAKEKFRQLNNKDEYAKTLLLLAEDYNKKGDVNNAIKYSEKTLNVYKQMRDISRIACIENNLGKLFYEFDNIEESFLHLKNAKELKLRTKDKSVVNTLVDICENYIKLKDIENAKLTINEIMDNIDDGSDIALVSYYLLKYRIDIMESNLKEAENTLIMALNFVKKMNYANETAKICIMIGKFYIDNNRDKEAAKYLNEGVETFKKIGVLKQS
ncbi:helix-turn-helix domain-containing protein [Clostridium fermenticellae]|uniref:Helix-turn-helix domain-containing protein n=1 Tax=Clostridium fermenticellae TaxID=2068654 RepID=A0A386H641_9CLOT|nr:helix-turn-helix transcriptional regulator [Clostridium fermenticellae]AYD41120.1 helix-turn-helix domain-containing protein [Clostridium fermenticellae]